jgi:PBSX family phage portal protein
VAVTIIKNVKGDKSSSGGNSSLTIYTTKGESSNPLVTQSNSLAPEDAFSQLQTFTSKQPIISPPLILETLEVLPDQNNTLGICIEAMEVNIDGTGHTIVSAREDGGDPDPKLRRKIENFFKIPYPYTSMRKLRRKTRRDSESTGNGYWEIIRNKNGEIRFLKQVPSSDIRLLKLDDPVMAEVNVFDEDGPATVQVKMRQRRYAQAVGEKVVYFKDYGVTRNLNKDTGEWESAAKKVPADKRASEMLHFTINEHKSGYGTPRWIGNLPSALGSREAEELNLGILSSGGMPPALIIVQNGTVDGPIKQDLQTIFQGDKVNKTRAAILEIQGDGTIDKPGNVKVKIERLDTKGSGDFMYDTYDASCSNRVRKAFRLPPMFTGDAHEYSFASAYASYTVAEAQVFAPERGEFDDCINNTIMRELDPSGTYVFRSNPLTVGDIEHKVKLLTIASTSKLASKASLLSSINEIGGMALIKASKNEYKNDGNSPLNDPTNLSANNSNDIKGTLASMAKSETSGTKVLTVDFDPVKTVTVCSDIMEYLNEKEKDPERKQEISEIINDMGEQERTIVSLVVASGLGADITSYIDPLASFQ